VRINDRDPFVRGLTPPAANVVYLDVKPTWNDLHRRRQHFTKLSTPRRFVRLAHHSSASQRCKEPSPIGDTEGGVDIIALKDELGLGKNRAVLQNNV
jgi:hypothetical protein